MVTLPLANWFWRENHGYMPYRRIFLALLVTQILYLAATPFVDFLPGWKMFESVERAEFKMTDYDSKKTIDVRSYLPPVYYSLPAGAVKELAGFICRKEHIRVQLEIKGAPPLVTRDDCKI